MKKGFIYHLLRVLTLPMQLFPLEFHYLISNLLYVMVYHVLRYRRGVVAENLRNSFPEKTAIELKKIEKAFYLNFCDMFIETLYFTHVDLKKAAKRLKIENMELMHNLIEQKRNIIGVTGHYGNWEYMQIFDYNYKAKTYFVYKKLNNKAFDRFHRDRRGRNAIPLEMKQTPRTLITDDATGDNFVALFISDQRPMKREIKHWVTFMNQDTPVMLGTEKIARKTNAAIVYLEIKKIKRGYHQVSFTLLTDQVNSLPQNEATDIFMKQLESSIKKNPAQYLWSHKRWKFQKT